MAGDEIDPTGYPKTIKAYTLLNDSVLRVAGDFVDLSHNELIRSLNQQSVEFRHPQPVNLTPGALGVRCEE